MEDWVTGMHLSGAIWDLVDASSLMLQVSSKRYTAETTAPTNEESVLAV